MSRRNKLEKFAEMLGFSNVYQNFDPTEPGLTAAGGEEVRLKGEWAAKHFGNDQPITLELACGKGDYTLGLARKYGHRNFIGIDIKGARIWKGAKIALEDELDNVAFLRTRIEQISYFFEEGEVEEIWITFPDPFLRKSKANRRLTGIRFLEQYRRILQKGGKVHLKTDSPLLYDFTLQELSEYSPASVQIQNDDIYASDLSVEELEIKTFYEKMHLAEGKKIKYIQFRLF
ncbi:MAG: tRNA (guanosine(46)-N7)-methyltransferase TrmB [Saprospiraceae bacterium]|nr:tRNA (guanosine(46)-N7)-methyltransferase TrmB [Saprospiraceae bacterium]